MKRDDQIKWPISRESLRYPVSSIWAGIQVRFNSSKIVPKFLNCYPRIWLFFLVNRPSSFPRHLAIKSSFLSIPWAPYGPGLSKWFNLLQIETSSDEYYSLLSVGEWKFFKNTGQRLKRPRLRSTSPSIR